MSPIKTNIPRGVPVSKKQCVLSRCNAKIENRIAFHLFLFGSNTRNQPRNNQSLKQRVDCRRDQVLISQSVCLSSLVFVPIAFSSSLNLICPPPRDSIVKMPVIVVQRRGHKHDVCQCTGDVKKVVKLISREFPDPRKDKEHALQAAEKSFDQNSRSLFHWVPFRNNDAVGNASDTTVPSVRQHSRGSNHFVDLCRVSSQNLQVRNRSWMSFGDHGSSPRSDAHNHFFFKQCLDCFPE